MKKTCAICNSEYKMMSRNIVGIVGNDWVCRNCIEKANLSVLKASYMRKRDILARMEEKFTLTYEERNSEIGSSAIGNNRIIEVDEVYHEHKKAGGGLLGKFGSKSSKPICSVCNHNIGKKELLDGVVCQECIDKCYPFMIIRNYKNISTLKIKEAINAAKINVERTKKFNPTKKINKYFEVDEQNKMWKISDSAIIFTYGEIVDFNLIENGESVSKGSLSGALVGGVLFGGAGAIVGSGMNTKNKKEISQYMIKIVTRNVVAPEATIDFQTGKIKANGMLYNSYAKIAQSIMAQLTIMKDSERNTSTIMQTSNADEIFKFKQLLDAGIITHEEFEAKKKQLLGL